MNEFWVIIIKDMAMTVANAAVVVGFFSFLAYTYVNMLR